MNRRPRGEGGLRWDESRQRWIATITVGYDGRGKRVVRKASGKSRTEASTKLRSLVREQENGLATGKEGYTVADAVEDFLAFGLSRQEAVTVGRYRSLSQRHLLPRLGARRLRALTAREVDTWLAGLAGELSTDSLRRLHGCLNRSVRRAMSRDLVSRNVVELAEIPTGRVGRPSKSLSPEQVDSVLTDTAPDRLHGYIVISLLTGARTEEMRALRLDHVHLDEHRGVPPHIEVWRSVRSGGDTNTRRSRRTLALPSRAVEALRRERVRQVEDRLVAGERWRESGLVFTTGVGTEMDAANVRRGLRRALAVVEGVEPAEWTPRELRHSFVSVLSDAGVPLEEISRLVGHSGTTVTELVYRHQLRPVIQTGATVMDRLFGSDAGQR